MELGMFPPAPCQPPPCPALPTPPSQACIYFCIILWMRESGRELVLGHNYPEIYLLTANLCNLLELYF